MTSRLRLVAVLAALVVVATAATYSRPTASADTTTTSSSHQAIFIGDSYTQGVGASSKATRWTSLLSAHEGWVEDNRGRGGTGFVTRAGRSGCGRAYCPTFYETARSLTNTHPAVIVIAGGQNDLRAWVANPAKVKSRINATYSKLRRDHPTTPIVSVGPSQGTRPGATIAAMDRQVHAAAAAIGAEYVSLLDPQVVTRRMLAADGVHVNDTGHAAIARRVEAGPRNAGKPLTSHRRGRGDQGLPGVTRVGG